MRTGARKLSKSIAACITNGEKLLQDANLLFGWDRFSTALALAVLAQEEFAKAFLLQLVEDDALPWLPEVRRSIARHQCKHLLAIVMEWLPSWDWDRLIERLKRDDGRHKQRIEGFTQARVWSDPAEDDLYLPHDVATALNIYRHEELEKLRSGEPYTSADWTGKARKVAEGLLDRKKQSALYVDSTKDGDVGLHPGLITGEDASAEIRRARRLSEAPDPASDEYRKLKELFPPVFASRRARQAKP